MNSKANRIKKLELLAGVGKQKNAKIIFYSTSVEGERSLWFELDIGGPGADKIIEIEHIDGGSCED